FVDSTMGLAIIPPNIGIATAIETSTDSSSPGFDVKVFSGTSNTFAPVLGVEVFANTAHDNLETWFKHNIDSSGILLTSKTFKLVQLSGGRSALLLSGPVPAEYLNVGGPVQFEYLISPSGDKIVAITEMQDHQLGEFGFSR